jgi:hypothetical protein
MENQKNVVALLAERGAARAAQRAKQLAYAAAYWAAQPADALGQKKVAA